MRHAICNFALTPRGAQPVISGRRLILKAIYPVANFIAACANREDAIIRGSFINAKDPIGALRLHCDLHPDPRSDFIKNTSNFEAHARNNLAFGCISSLVTLTAF